MTGRLLEDFKNFGGPVPEYFQVGKGLIWVFIIWIRWKVPLSDLVIWEMSDVVRWNLHVSCMVR